jgi:hypothetical protein
MGEAGLERQRVAGAPESVLPPKSRRLRRAFVVPTNA